MLELAVYGTFFIKHKGEHLHLFGNIMMDFVLFAVFGFLGLGMICE